MFIKKAAMFGLDARIAFAIFASLSVIAGAALYKVLSKMDEVKVMATFNEVEKALESYILDTNQDLPATVDYVGQEAWIKQIGELIDSTKKGWRGPYLPVKSSGVDYAIRHNVAMTDAGGNTFVYATQDDDQDVINGGASNCVSNKNCYYWIALTHMDVTLGYDIDKKYDDGNPLTGNIRLQHAVSNPPNTDICKKVFPVLRH